MKVFISHDSDESSLALAWKELLTGLMSDIEIFVSSDTEDPGGGMGIGKWRELIHTNIIDADIVIAILSPDSGQNPWIVWECTVAAENQKEIIPVHYSMTEDEIHPVLSERESFDGAELESVQKLCCLLVEKTERKRVQSTRTKYWKQPLNEYFEIEREDKEKRRGEKVFDDHFHNRDSAAKLCRDWWVKWTIEHDGEQKLWEFGQLYVWCTRNRIRMVGSSDKGKEVSYPMEGVVSDNMTLALSYWSRSDIPFCGTCVMQPYGSMFDTFVGNWQGTTQSKFDERPFLGRGCVIMSRDEETARSYLDILPP